MEIAIFVAIGILIIILYYIVSMAIGVLENIVSMIFNVCKYLIYQVKQFYYKFFGVWFVLYVVSTFMIYVYLNEYYQNILHYTLLLYLVIGLLINIFTSMFCNKYTILNKILYQNDIIFNKKLITRKTFSKLEKELNKLILSDTSYEDEKKILLDYSYETLHKLNNLILHAGKQDLHNGNTIQRNNENILRLYQELGDTYKRILDFIQELIEYNNSYKATNDGSNSKKKKMQEIVDDLKQF
jgi:hypothetical protein